MNSSEGAEYSERMLGPTVVAATKLVQNLIELNCRFLISPTIRFKSEPGEQGTFFINDPSGNVLEFKTFKKDTRNTDDN